MKKIPSTLMNRSLPIFAAFLLTSVQAADLTHLESLGARVTRKGEVVTELTLTDCTKVGQAELRTIGGITTLKSLTLFGKLAGLTDHTVDFLLPLQSLESLSTEGAQLSDAGLAKLAGLKALRSAAFFHLSFRKEGFTGTGFASWKSLPNLQRLTVAGMSMGDAGFAAIAEIQTLRELSTWHTWQTEAGNAEIAKLPNLTSLKLGQRLPRTGIQEPSLSDLSLPTVAKIHKLETLKLGEARFTLKALRELKALPNLKSLTIYETDIPPADIETLQAELPSVRLTFEPLTEEQRKKLEMYLKEAR